MIEPKEVKKTAELARIELASEEEKKLSKDLESVLDYIDKLKEVGTDGVLEPEHAFGFNDFRADEPPKEIFDSAPLLEATPETERGFIKVKKILDKE